MKLMPASRAFATIRADVASSVGPPNIMVPRQIGEIFRPLRPRWRYCIGSVLTMLAPSPRFCGERVGVRKTKRLIRLLAERRAEGMAGVDANDAEFAREEF